MTSPEFAVMLAWVLLQPLAIALVLLAVLHRRNAWVSFARTLLAALILVLVSCFFALGFVLAGPQGLGPLIGIRDEPVPWAPFAFVSVALALPIAIRWASRGSRQ